MNVHRASQPPAMEPVHPGSILREDVLPALGLSISEVARRLDVSRQALHNVLSCKSDVSPEMAVRLGRFLGNGAEFWVRLQAAHSLWHAEQRLRNENIPRYEASTRESRSRQIRRDRPAPVRPGTSSGKAAKAQGR